MSYLLLNDGSKLLLSGRDDGSALLLSGDLVLIDVVVIMSVTDEPGLTVSSGAVQSLSDAGTLFTTNESLLDSTEDSQVEVTNQSIQTVSQEHVQDVD
jgi:hypothetical protein